MAEYIERGALLREIERREALMVGDKLVSVDAMKSFIKNRPAAYVAPVRHGRWVRRGRWVHTDLAAHWKGKDECSECTYHERDRNDLSRFNYCPNCGAKMDLEDER